MPAARSNSARLGEADARMMSDRGHRRLARHDTRAVPLTSKRITDLVIPVQTILPAVLAAIVRKGTPHGREGGVRMAHGGRTRHRRGNGGGDREKDACGCGHGIGRGSVKSNGPLPRFGAGSTICSAPGIVRALEVSCCGCAAAGPGGRRRNLDARRGLRLRGRLRKSRRRPVEKEPPASVANSDPQKLPAAQLLNGGFTHSPTRRTRGPDQAVRRREVFGDLPRHHLAVLMQLDDALRVEGAPAAKFGRVVEEPEIDRSRAQAASRRP